MQLIFDINADPYSTLMSDPYLITIVDQYPISVSDQDSPGRMLRNNSQLITCLHTVDSGALYFWSSLLRHIKIH